MADATPVGGPTGGPGSADPKAILRDLKQLAIVAQKLGIDLQKTAAMGQQVAGQKGQTGNLNEQHAATHPGGGTGYTNMAQGAIAGSTMSAKMGKANVSQSIDDYKRSGLAQAWKQVVEGPKFLPIKGRPSGYIPPHQYNQPSGPSSPWAPDPFYKIVRDAQQRQGKGMLGAYNKYMDTAFGSKMNRRFARMFLTVHGATQMYGALTGPIDESSGETRGTKIADVGAGMLTLGGRMYEASMMLNVGENAAQTWRLGKAVAKARGAGLVGRSLFAAGRVMASAGPQVLITAAVEAGIKSVEEGMASWKFGNKLEKDMAKFKQGMLGDLGRKKEKIEGYEYPAQPKPLSADQISKMASVLEQSRRDYYIDEEGRRQKRGIIQRGLFAADNAMGSTGWVLAPLLKLWNWWGGAEDKAKDLKWRMEMASKAHEAGIKKAQVMDWEGAIQETQKAKALIVAEEAMPFFWKQPEKFLRAMESSRIAGRNWARSQQPRGASRSGD